MSMRWVEDRVLERPFEVACEGRRVPGVVWTPLEGRGPRPLVLAGHGFTMSKRALFPLTLANDLVLRFGFAVAAIDVPGHGDRQPDGGRDAGASERDWFAHWRAHGASQIAADFGAALDALQRTSDVGPSSVAYWGLSLGTQYGMGFIGAESRVRAAVLGLCGIPARGTRIASYAERVTCPVFFIRQLDDEVWPAESTAALFDRLATKDKQMRTSPGRHTQVPGAVFEEAYAFLAKHLGGHSARPGGSATSWAEGREDESFLPLWCHNSGA